MYHILRLLCAGEEACVLPDYNSKSVEVVPVSSGNRHYIKYKLTCVDADDADNPTVLPSYVPKELTCYPEGNWDKVLSKIPDCGK